MTREQVVIRFLQTIEYWRNNQPDESCTHGVADNCVRCLANMCAGTMSRILHFPDGDPTLGSIRWQPAIIVRPAPEDDASRTCADCQYSYLTVEQAKECLRRHKADEAYRT